MENSQQSRAGAPPSRPAAVNESAPDVSPPAAPGGENYRYYLRAAVLVGMLAGAALGTVNLTWIAVWGYTGNMPHWEWWPALIQAHGDAQLYGWTGLFIIGIAGHSLPRMRRRPAPPPWLARAVFASILGGLVLGLFAQPLAAYRTLAPVFPAAMALQWIGVTLFAGCVLPMMRWPRAPWEGLVFAGTLWFWLGASARLWLSLTAIAAGTGIPSPAGNAAYLHAMTWGFLLCFVLGYSLRLLPTFAGLPEGHRAAAWGALCLLTAGAVTETATRLAGLPVVSLGAMTVTTVGVGCAVAALRLWRPVLAEDDKAATWLARFARTAYGWLCIAAVLLLVLRVREVSGPAPPLYQHAFGGAARHAFAVGFVSLMMVGVAWRILPIFSGAERPPPARIAWVYGLLICGCLFRVTGQVASGLWGGGWFGVMGISGWLELGGVMLFGMDVLRLLNGTPVQAVLPDAGAPVELSPEAPVGPLVAHRPWLVPVFARHGMGQVSHPLFQRSLGQRVTVAQACRRFGIEPVGFFRELVEAEVGKEPENGGYNTG
jgi:hypothetical protein